MIRILKASAGSGKTHNLAKTYIQLLLRSQERYAYRHILAVTFTNKATDQMKSRILKELDILAHEPAKSAYIEELLAEFPSMEQIRERAAGLLVDMLHDYGAFAVSTIDKFFQQALKAFAREIGQFASYQVELDKPALVHESVDRILDALTGEDKELLRWLTDSAMDQLEQTGRFNLEQGLYEMAEALKSDEHREIVERNRLDEKRIYDKTYLQSVRKACRAFRSDFCRQVEAAAGQALDALARGGVTTDQTSYKFMAVLQDTYSQLDPKADVPAPTEAWMRRAGDPQQWFSKKNAHLLPQVEGLLEDPLQAFCALFDRPFKAYNTAGILLRQIYSLGLAGEIYRSFDALVREKNVMSLDESSVTLRRIIDGSDAPFVYEKLGVRFEDFLLDEFQDTSTVQWDNFRPLLSESDANGRDNLIVGDVKQSIYRWRGSDWNLLATEVKQAFPQANDRDPLQENWRSLRTIVTFNNGFFPWAAEQLDLQYGGEKGLISAVYADVEQAIRTRDPEPGSVEVTFCDKDGQMDAVLESIRTARGAGARYGHIAVLVRNNASGSDIAGFLVDQGVPVISDDSLRVKSSVTVRRLVSLMSSVENRSDKVAGYLARQLDIPIPESYHSLVDLAESLLRALNDRDEALFDGEVLYIQSFMDELQDWVAAHGNNLAGFLKAWADADPKISSPEDPDAVRILTIHKSKGLEFPYVIFPYAETVGLYRDETRWSRPDLTGTSLEGVADGAYRVSLSSKKSPQTLFSKDFAREKLLQYMDNLNTFYVALTRAEKGLHIIAAEPSAAFVQSCEKGSPSYSDLSQVLYAWLYKKPLHFGALYDFHTLKEKEGPAERLAQYPSYPLNPSAGDGDVDVRERGRLKLSADAVDYFREDALVRSPRLKGLVLHAILADTVVPEDLDGAVAAALERGDFDAEQAGRYRSFLTGKIASVADLGWFPEDRAEVRNELTLIGLDGRDHRPDRVVVAPDEVRIIDFKFGEESPSHRKQVARYAALYRAMGYGKVRGWLWYIREEGADKIVEV